MPNSRYWLRPRPGRENDRNIHKLPEVILFQIFLKLSMEDVVKCKCTCMTWGKLLEDPYFVEMHLRHSHAQVPQLLLQPMVTPIECGYVGDDGAQPVNSPRLVSGRDAACLYLVDTELSHMVRRIPMNPDIDLQRKELRITSTCRGLVCIASELRPDPVYVLNPILNRYTRLPSTDFTRKLLYHDVSILFHASSGTYKLVRAYQYRIYDHEAIKFEVITMGEEGVWREIKHTLAVHQCVLERRSMVWNGFVHWKIYSPEVENSPICMLSLDIDKETFQVVSFEASIAPPYNKLKMLLMDDNLIILEQHQTLLKIWKVEVDSVGNLSIRFDSTVETNATWGGAASCEWLAKTTIPNTHTMHVTQGTGIPGYVRSNLVNFSTETESFSHLVLSGTMPDHFTTWSYNPSLVLPPQTRRSRKRDRR